VSESAGKAPVDRAIALLEGRRAVGMERYKRVLADDDPRDMGHEADEELADWLVYWMAYRERQARRVSELEDERERLRRVVAAQGKALAHWRRGADRDAGKIERYESTLVAITRAQSLESAQRMAREELG
jgi:hypothetical protein